uniref:Uncharacterized protein n=1 Tax=Cacopsylla melanoneura TaxID=428564 RepID=A0A8D8U770_9HEMI
MFNPSKEVNAHMNVTSRGEDVVEEDTEVNTGQVGDWGVDAGGGRIFGIDGVVVKTFILPGHPPIKAELIRVVRHIHATSSIKVEDLQTKLDTTVALVRITVTVTRKRRESGHFGLGIRPFYLQGNRQIRMWIKINSIFQEIHC